MKPFEEPFKALEMALDGSLKGLPAFLFGTPLASVEDRNITIAHGALRDFRRPF